LETSTLTEVGLVGMTYLLANEYTDARRRRRRRWRRRRRRTRRRRW
jgi:hypothetical protein